MCARGNPTLSRRRLFVRTDGTRELLSPSAWSRSRRAQAAGAARWGKVVWDDSQGVQRLGTLAEYAEHAKRSRAAGGRPRPPQVPEEGATVEDYGARTITVPIPLRSVSSWPEVGAWIGEVWATYQAAGRPLIAEVVMFGEGTVDGEPVTLSTRLPVALPGRGDPKLGNRLGATIERAIRKARGGG
jgi:hypothetical protein